MTYSESYARRALKRLGYFLRKYRIRTREDPRYGRYLILDMNNWIVSGPRDSIDLADVYRRITVAGRLRFLRSEHAGYDYKRGFTGQANAWAAAPQP